MIKQIHSSRRSGTIPGTKVALIDRIRKRFSTLQVACAAKLF